MKFKNSKFLLVFFIIICLFGAVFSTSTLLDVKIDEYVDQEVWYNPLKTGGGYWYDSNENQSYYNLTGKITITNVNPEGLTISDIYIDILNTSYITLPVLLEGRNGTFIFNDTTSDHIVLHIPELEYGENSTWIYFINRSAVKPPLNFTSSYSDTKILAGSNITVYDTIQNVFENRSYQDSPCIYNINITQNIVPVDFNGYPQYFYFIPSSTGGSDSGNVTYSIDNLTQYWYVLNGTCLDKGTSTDINYIVETPLNIPKTTHYPFINSTIRYILNNTISYIRVTDIKAISEAQLSFEKKIIAPSHPTLYGSNVTWNVTAYFNTTNNISYNLTKVTLWVAKRNAVSGDPNTIDNDTISGAPLNITFYPMFVINKSNQWISPSWLFNYSDLPTPIVWFKTNFTILDDNIQLIRRSFTQNKNDIYIKEIYLIIGYWLEINKNITFLGNNTYHIRVDVHNKGNQVTPADTVVMIYDFVPEGFNLSGSFAFSSSPWYTTTWSNYSISGNLTGTLYKFGLTSNNALNTSFAAGPAKNENTTWFVEYNVTGIGDYKATDVFITGLDPMKVDGAGSSKAVVISEIFERVKSREGLFSITAIILLLLSILI